MWKRKRPGRDQKYEKKSIGITFFLFYVNYMKPESLEKGSHHKRCLFYPVAL